MPAWVPIEAYELATGDDSYGTIIRVSDGDSPETFHAIAGVGNISGPNKSAAVTEVLTHSTGVPYKNKRPGIIDSGEFSFPCNFDPANPSHSLTSVFGLGYMMENRSIRTWQVIYPDASNTTIEFQGFVSQIGSNSPVEGVRTGDTTITIDGAVTEVDTPTP